MPTEKPILRICLEEVGARHWWVALFATLSSQSGNAYMRFVGVVEGDPEYVSATFPVPRTLGTIPPEEAWAPDMTKSLEDLRERIESDGWRLVHRGEQPWELTYQSPPD